MLVSWLVDGWLVGWLNEWICSSVNSFLSHFFKIQMACVSSLLILTQFLKKFSAPDVPEVI